MSKKSTSFNDIKQWLSLGETYGPILNRFIGRETELFPYYTDQQSIELLYSQVVSRSEEQRTIQSSSKQAGKLMGKFSLGNLLQILSLPSGELSSEIGRESGKSTEISFSIPVKEKLKIIVEHLRENRHLIEINGSNNINIVEVLTSGPKFLLVRDLLKNINSNDVAGCTIEQGGLGPTHL